MNENLTNVLMQNAQPLVSAFAEKMAEGFNLGEIPAVKELKIVKDYYDAPSGSPEEEKLKKAISAAVIIARDKGKPVPGLTDKNATEIAAHVDTALTYSKALYLIGEGKMDSYELVSHLVDKAAARIVPVLDNLIDKYAVPAATAVVKAIAIVYPPAQAVLPYVKMAVPFIAQKTKALIHKSLPIVKKVTKNVLSQTINKATRVFAEGVKQLKKIFQ